MVEAGILSFFIGLRNSNVTDDGVTGYSEYIVSNVVYNYGGGVMRVGITVLARWVFTLIALFRTCGFVGFVTRVFTRIVRLGVTFIRV